MRADASETGPLRTCIVTRRQQAPEDMIRFVLGPEGIATPDLRRKLPGRGVWVSGTAGIVALAIKRKAFERSFKTKVIAPEGLVDDIEKLLARDCMQSLAMANKAGLVVTGFSKVESLIGIGDIMALFHAADGGADGKRKLGQALKRRFGGRGHSQDHDENVECAVEEIESFVSSQLDLALGRTNVIHAALRPAAASQALLQRCRRFAKYRALVE